MDLGGYDNTIAYNPILSDFETQENASHALDEYGEPPFESEAEREHATRSYVEKDRHAICMGLNVPYLPIDTFNNNNELWITDNREAALQMAPGNRSYPESVTFEQVVFANENWNALLKLHIKYWMNKTMLKSSLNCLLSEREVSTVEFIMSAIDPTTSSQIEKAQSNIPVLREAAQKLGTNTDNDWSTSPIALHLQVMEQCKRDIYEATLEANQINKETSNKMRTRYSNIPRPLPSIIQVEVPAVNPTKSTPTPSKQDDPINSSAMDGDK